MARVPRLGRPAKLPPPAIVSDDQTYWDTLTPKERAQEQELQARIVFGDYSYEADQRAMAASAAREAKRVMRQALNARRHARTVTCHVRRAPAPRRPRASVRRVSRAGRARAPDDPHLADHDRAGRAA